MFISRLHEDGVFWTPLVVSFTVSFEPCHLIFDITQPTEMAFVERHWWWVFHHIFWAWLRNFRPHTGTFRILNPQRWRSTNAIGGELWNISWISLLKYWFDTTAFDERRSCGISRSPYKDLSYTCCAYAGVLLLLWRGVRRTPLLGHPIEDPSYTYCVYAGVLLLLWHGVRRTP